MSVSDSYAEVLRFHGHECPGAAFGTRVAEVATERFGRHDLDNELVAVVETDACAVDAIQVITGCTFGKRNIRHRNEGKNAFSFWRRADGAGIRIQAKPDSLAYRTPELWALANKVERGVATGEESERFAALQAERTKQLLTVPVEELLLVSVVTEAPPNRKPLHASVPCEQCAEQTEIDRLHNHRGHMVCPSCHLAAHGGTLPPGHDGSEGNHHHHHH